MKIFLRTGLRNYLTLDGETVYEGSYSYYPLDLATGSSCLVVALVGAYKELRVIKVTTGEGDITMEVSVQYSMYLCFI